MNRRTRENTSVANEHELTASTNFRSAVLPRDLHNVILRPLGGLDEVSRVMSMLGGCVAVAQEQASLGDFCM